MSNITFAILDASVTKENQVFDHLVPVRRLDTQEEGLLLCSHCCKWPEELIPQATWLEGCFTPEEWREESRLLTGYHPDHLVNWSIDWDAREVTVSLVESVQCGGDAGGGGLLFPIPYTQLNSECKLYKRIDRYMRMIEGETWGEYLSGIFSATLRLHQQGRVGLEFVLGVPAWVMNQVDGAVPVHYTLGEWALQITQPFDLDRMETSFALGEDGLISQGPSQLLPTIPIRRRRRRQRFEDEIPQVKVYVSIPEYGWEVAKSLPYFIDLDGLEVTRNVGDWAVAEPLVSGEDDYYLD